MKRLTTIFIFAFVTNVVWENLHSFLYIGYKGGSITEFILLRASFWDAIIISLMLLPFLYFKSLRNKTWMIFIIGFIIAIAIEWYAFGTGRWAYTSFMPIIPFIKTGLTPTVQLGILGYLTYKFQEHIHSGKRVCKE